MKKSRKFYAVEYQKGYFTKEYEYSKEGLEYAKKHRKYLKSMGYAKHKIVVFKIVKNKRV